MSKEGFPPNLPNEKDVQRSAIEHPTTEETVDFENRRLQQYVDRRVKQNLRIQAILANNRNNQQTGELITAGIYEEVGYFTPEEDDKIGQLYLKHAENGIQSKLVNVYDESNEVVGLRLFKVNAAMDEGQMQMKATIEKKYDDEYRKNFFYQEKEKERRFLELVERGELIYVGEVGVKELGTLQKDGIGYADTESVAAFDENMEPLYDVEKIFVRAKPQSFSRNS
jgi:hypothetical protein